MKNKSAGLLVLRLAVGAVFLVHGIMKLALMHETIVMFQGMGFHPALAWVVAIVETLGGAMLVLGVGTAFAGVLLAIIMLVAMKVMYPMGLMEVRLPFVLFAAALGIAMTGPGKYTVGMVCGCGNCHMCKDGQNTCGTDCDCDCSKK